MQESGSRAAQFHLKDGRPLIFHSIPESVLRRRAGEILLILMLLAAGMLAATLLAGGRVEAPRASVVRARRAAVVPR
jgi:hypothetical protein